jgi:hypothetical protein
MASRGTITRRVGKAGTRAGPSRAMRRKKFVKKSPTGSAIKTTIGPRG